MVQGLYFGWDFLYFDLALFMLCFMLLLWLRIFWLKSSRDEISVKTYQ